MIKTKTKTLYVFALVLLVALLGCNSQEKPGSGEKDAGKVDKHATADSAGNTQPGAAAKSGDTKGPKLLVEKKNVDVGDVQRGEKATHTFVLRNVGTDVLHIKKAKGS